MYVLIKSYIIYIYIYIYIYTYIYIYIYTIGFYLIKSSYTERKEVIWFLIFLRYSLTVLLSSTKSSSVTITHLVVWNTTANSVTHTLQRCIFLNVLKLYSAIFDYKAKFLMKILYSMNYGWLKETFWQYVTIFMG